MKVISFNANGIRSAAQKGFYLWLEQQQADFVCIQETKAQYGQLIQDQALYFPGYFYCEYVDAVKKGYSGVAIYAREQPVSVTKTLGFELSDLEGRYLQFDYPRLSVISIYFPSGTSGEIRQRAKYEFLEQMTPHFAQLKASGRELILCGDFNIAHRQIDLKNWRANKKNSGFLPEERAWLDLLFDSLGFVDAFRLLNQQPEQYTWWSHRGQARANNVGWRIDYQVITQGLVGSVVDVGVYRERFFSDHAPLCVEYEGIACV